MKKVLIFPALLLLMAIWYGESRKFFCAGDGECVTVWKTYNNVCYIVPGKYYGIIRPSDNYIKTSNINLVSIFYSPKLPRVFIIQPGLGVRFINGDTARFTFYNYYADSAGFNQLLFAPSQTGDELKPGVRVLNIDIREDYELGGEGKDAKKQKT